MTAYLLVHVGSTDGADEGDGLGEGSDREYVREPGDELQTDLGVLTVPPDASPGDLLETHLGELFRVRNLRLPDLFDHFERTGAPMVPRDVGLVLGETGAATGDRVLDAGTGTGVLAAALGRTGAAVVTYERDPDFAAVARENMTLAGLSDDVTVRTDDVTDALDALVAEDGPFDLITLDIENATPVIERAGDLLVPGGFLAVYSPFMETAREADRTARAVGLREVRTVETIQRELQADDRGTRPTPAAVGHTGYLTFARRS